jgi:pimeloyl-ACP methyl ester carboxylesterase
MDTFEPFADELLAEVLDAFEVERAHLVATSFGAYFALRAAAAYPRRVDRMVLLGFPVGAYARHTPLSMRMTAVPGLGSLMTRLPVGHRMARSMLRQLGLGPALDAGRLPEEGIAWFRSLLNDTETIRNEIAAMPPLMHPRRGVSPALVLDDDLLGAITSPTFFLWGAKDPIGSEEVARAFAPKIPSAHLEMLPEAGHVPWLDQPDYIASAVARVLENRGDAAG